MSHPHKTEPRWERRKDARPAELLAAALDLFVERGFAATRLEDVAARAGVSKGTLYLYFESKEDLFKAVVRNGIVGAIERAERMVTEHQGRAAELLACLVRGWWSEVFSQPAGGIIKLLLAESGNFPELADFFHAEVVVRSRQPIVQAIERGIEAGEFRRVDLAYFVHLVMSPLVLLSISQHSIGLCRREGLEPERYVEMHIEQMLAGLAAAGGAGRSGRST